jgi:hypothetical protein
LELEAQSSSRNGAAVLWIVIHTAEGPTDEFPSRPDLDAGSAEDLLAFFRGKTDRSCHAIADDDKLLDRLVDYSRAAWTLRNGNPRSDNLEMCGLASWSRAEWLTHKGMLSNAARWVAGRLKARQMPVHRVTVAECAARTARGYMDHNTYTVATKDGTHWDCGPNFPWDVFGQMVTLAYNGGNPIMATLDAQDIAAIAKAVWDYGVKNDSSGAVMSAGDRLVDAESLAGQALAQVGKSAYLLMYGDDSDDGKDPATHPNNLQTLRAMALTAQAQVASALAALNELAAAAGQPVDYDRLTQIVDAAAERAVSGVDVVFTPPQTQ